MSDKKFRSSDARQLKSILREDTSIFHVPPFQRAYTWKSSNINDLWNSMVENEEGYFIGNMVWLENGGDYMIIDGQQRMFTISLILIALRNMWKSLDETNPNPKKSEYINNWVNDITEDIFFKDISSYPSKEKLRLTPAKENLRNVFEYIAYNSNKEIKKLKEIEGKVLDDNQKVFIRNYKHINNLISNELETGDYFEKLAEISTKVQSLYIIPIICASDVDAYKIFEGLNATGVGLSVVDLVKNAVMYSVQDEAYKSQIENTWENLENLFETTNISLFNKFLRHHWIATESYINNSQLFDAIKESKLKNKTVAEIISYTKDLSNSSKIYVGFRINDKRDYLKEELKKKGLKEFEIEEILDLYDRFTYLRNEQVYEVLLSVTNKFIKSEKFTFKQYAKFVQNLWSFIFRTSVLSVNPSDYEKQFANICILIKNFRSNDYNKILLKQTEFLANIVQGVDIDASFKGKFLDNEFIIYQDNGDNRLINYILRTIIQADNPAIKIAEPTIEHILPKEPSKWNMDRNEISDYVNKIGNLTCLNEKLNKRASNLGIQEKCEKVFNKSEFPINQSIKDYIEMYKTDPISAINGRAKIYAERANSIWKIS